MSDTIKNRRFAAVLLKNVRLGKLSVRQAVLQYPKDSRDESLIAAYHALIHYEADEDIRLTNLLYKEEQDDYIEFIYTALERGDDLPKNIIDSYKLFYQNAPIVPKQDLKGFWKSFWKYLNIKDN